MQNFCSVEKMNKFLQKNTQIGPTDYLKIRSSVAEQWDIITAPSMSDVLSLVSKPILKGRLLLSEYTDYMGCYVSSSEILKPYISGLNTAEVHQRIERDHPELFARLLLHSGRVAYRDREFAEAHELTQQSHDVYVQLGDEFGVGMSLFFKAGILHRERKFADAKAHVQAAIQAFAQLGMDGGSAYRMALCQVLLGWINCRKGDLDDGRTWLVQAEAILNTTDDLVHKGSIKNIMGSIERAGSVNGDGYEKAEVWLFRCVVSPRFHAGFREILHESS